MAPKNTKGAKKHISIQSTNEKCHHQYYYTTTKTDKNKTKIKEMQHITTSNNNNKNNKNKNKRIEKKADDFLRTKRIKKTKVKSTRCKNGIFHENK